MKAAVPLLVVALFFAGWDIGQEVAPSYHRAAPPPPPRYARQLHQPGAPVLKAPVRTLSTAGDGQVRAAGATCGKERWSVKTATDPAAGGIALQPKIADVRELGELPTTNPGNPDQPRDSGVESQVYQVTAYLVEAKRESDGDFHLVLKNVPPVEGESPTSDPSMIAEIPDAPACTTPPITERVSALELQIEAARAAFTREFGEPQGYPHPGLKIGHEVTVTGVGFFDVPHGQTGVAPNAVELHPVLTIEDP